MAKKFTIRGFFDKIEWEGGYYMLAQYGVSPEEIKDKKLAELWAKYLEKYADLEKIEQELEKLKPLR